MFRQSDRVARVVTQTVLASALCLAAMASQASTVDPKALLKSMSNYVSSQQAIDLTFDSDIEVVTSEMEKIQFTSSGEVQLSRPDKLHAHRVGGYADVELFFDGKTASIHGHNIGAYAQINAPGSIDNLVNALREGHGVAMPGADLLMSDSFKVLSADITEAKYIGRGVVEGVECEHLAFRNQDVDWQLWIQLGDRPIPRKMVLTSKTISGSPQYTVRIKTWKTGEKFAAKTFQFTPTAGMTKLESDQLIGLDELPEGTPSGASK